MKTSLLALSAAAFGLALCPATAQPTLLWSQGNPSGEEQQAMEWLNVSRRDPTGTLDGLLALGSSDSVIAAFLLAESPVSATQLDSWIQADWQNAQADSAAYPNSEGVSQAPLVFYPLFQQEAAALGAGANPPAPVFPSLRQPPAYLYPVPLFGQALLTGPSGVLSGPDATGGTAQFGPYGSNAIEIAQANLYSASVTPREWMLTQLIASYPEGTWSPPPGFLLQGDSLPNLTLGHTRMVGISILPGQYGNRILTVAKGSSEFFTQSDLPFGAAGTVFITGVAYKDANANGVYDPGEGIGGLAITPDHGAWYAVTSASGGYAIPVPANSGSYTLAASGAGGLSATASVSVGADSVQADWVWPAAALQPPAQVAVPAPDGVNQMTGFSTRGLVETGDDTLIGGFVISGPPSAAKQLLIRGVGPSLQTVGFPAAECVPATQIQVLSGSAVIAGNSGWTSAPDGGAAAAQAAVQVGDFPLTNWAGGGGDSALVASLPPGAYTVLVSPGPGTAPQFQTGRVGLVEVYDLSPGDGSRLVNLSTRCLGAPGDDRTILGCTVSGTGHDRLLIRESGPALAATFGLAGTLANPSVTLFDASGNPLASNAGWGASAQADQIAALAAAAGAFAWAATSADAAVVARVPPGNVTAVAAGGSAGLGTGLNLIEVYEAP